MQLRGKPPYLCSDHLLRGKPRRKDNVRGIYTISARALLGLFVPDSNRCHIGVTPNGSDYSLGMIILTIKFRVPVDRPKKLAHSGRT
ncbi:uncharacterized protein G2W53_040702 [Senna tora]|uniref:Uncharacterized protein n=1 Tax=Senna tora TaxID=362788 RepID=A0A834W0R0_9FABA|nr:uncharacterized protein G2W53_040702 [Senna tora]